MNAFDRWEPLDHLLTELLDRVAAEIRGCLGTALTVRRDGGPPSVLATCGVGDRLAPIQLRRGGPIADAAGSGQSVSTDDLFADERWPGLSDDALVGKHPDPADRWRRVRGAVAVGGLSGDDTLVVSATLDGPASPEARAVLRRYEKLTADLLVRVAGAAATGAPDQVQAMLASRATIEQAKGAIMALRGCDVEEAWRTLRRCSQEFNVKVRDLAAALVELLGDPEVRRPAGAPPIRPDASAREAARRMWRAFTMNCPGP
ncbi:ANTAR domain-containing protein [Amycolatopsis sp. NPDC051371]|uniref:ANTAR domain-containing protein n=1 Tax=Amycolatopsis sp. NPDC051371 TaxID=3155800 RepID=UPI003435D06B